MIAIGIDPGKSGGIAAIFGDGRTVQSPMPDTERDLYELLRDIDSVEPGAVARLERVSSSPQMGVVSAFTFGRSYGSLIMALTAIGIPFEEVTPVTWQKRLSITYPAGSTDTQKKNITKSKAQQLFPDVRVTHAIADALLIAEFCRRTRS